MRLLATFLACSVLFLCSCGGTGVPPASEVSVTATADKTVLAPGETAALTSTIQGFDGSMVASWYVEESWKESNRTCRFDYPDTSANFTDCKYGYVRYDTDLSVAKQAVYYAPPTTGTYHVTFSVRILGNAFYSDTYEKTATITFTVK